MFDCSWLSQFSRGSRLSWVDAGKVIEGPLDVRDHSTWQMPATVFVGEGHLTPARFAIYEARQAPKGEKACCGDQRVRGFPDFCLKSVHLLG